MPRLVAAARPTDAVLDPVSLVVVGLGAVGRVLAMHLARLQPRQLWLIDSKAYSNHSLLNQMISPHEVGLNKARATAALCSQISPRTQVWAGATSVEQAALAPFAAADAVLLATDHIAPEIFTGQLCHQLGKPLFQGSVHGETLTVHARCAANDSASAPCLACGLSAAEWAALERDARFSCEGSHDPSRAGRWAVPATMSPSFLSAMAADLVASQLLRWLLGLGAPVGDTVVEYNLYSHASVVAPLRRNPRCPCDHARIAVKHPDAALSQRTLREIAGIAGFVGASAETAVCFEVEDWSWVERAACACSSATALERFVACDDAATPAACAVCGTARRPAPFYSHRRVPASVLGPQLDVRLRDLADRDARWVRVSSPERTILVLESFGTQP
jgi:molybdopterin/thiamine biosynthesis adenylyltransferase